MSVLMTLLISGCSIGPRVETKAVIVQPGTPVQILSDKPIKAMFYVREADGTVSERIDKVNVAGRVAIQPDLYNRLLEIWQKYRNGDLIERLPDEMD